MNMLEGQILYHQLLAQYWMAMATTGAAKDRDIKKQIDGKWLQLTDEEKIKSAMNIANNHIHLVGEMVEKLPTEAKYDYYKKVSA